MITVPSSFREMPRWWHDEAGRSWLEGLPAAVDEQCARWRLELDGDPLHGSNALVVPVRRGSDLFALRLCPPDDDIATEARALRLWDGRGTVRLFDVDEAAGSMLLERLTGATTLMTEPLEVAIPLLAELTRTLAIPVPEDVTSTASIAADGLATFESQWRDVGGPTPRYQLDRALDLSAERADGPLTAAPSSDLFAVDGDLHYDQVLAGEREPWIVVDPVLLRGDPEYDLGRVLWSRLDELPTESDVQRAFELFVDTAEVPADRASGWVVVRSMSYLLWGLPRGLTDDPLKCRRLLDLFC